jgi:hypothetical protein
MKMLIVIVAILAVGYSVASAQQQKMQTFQSPNHIYSNYINFNYVKRSLPPEQPNDNGIDFKQDGNNFYGIQIVPSFKLADSIGMISIAFDVAIDIQGGNVYGKYATYYGVNPRFDLMIWRFNVFFGAGTSGLLFFNNNNQYGGLGLSSSMGFTFRFYNDFIFLFSNGFESYANRNYYTSSIGLGLKL